jgi:hypothetical protein
MTLNGELLACSGRYDQVRDSGRPPLTTPIDTKDLADGEIRFVTDMD